MYIPKFWKPSFVVEVGLAPTRTAVQHHCYVFYRNGYPFSLSPLDL